MRGLAIAAITPALLLAACGGGSSPGGPSASDAAATPTTSSAVSPRAAAVLAEADDDPSLPGEYVDLPAIYGGPYPATAHHVIENVDYAAAGVGEPPAGGPHWATAACGEDPVAAPRLCGPAPWGIYRAPWPAETLVHNLEHAGVVIWYNTTDLDAIHTLEEFALDELRGGRQLVLAPYPDMPNETIAITTWSRRDLFAPQDLTIERLQTFIDAHYCRFDPEAFCR